MAYVAALKEEAKKKLTEQAYDYYSNGKGPKICENCNLHGFKRLKIIPSYLKGLKSVDTSTTLLGPFDVAAPIGFAPSGRHGMAHSQGEDATARAASSLSMCMVLSTWSSRLLEDVARAAPSAMLWYQTYIYKDRDTTLSFVRRAEKAGYKALVLTVDSVTGQFKPTVNSMKHIDTAFHQQGEPITNPKGGHKAFFVNLKLDADWGDIAWLKTQTKLPVIVKSILSEEDAKLAVRHKVDGIIVSNRGGRQTEALPSTIDMLPHIVDAVGGKLDVYIDGGIRSGLDVFKAVAIGAKAAFVGQPVLWALGSGGEEGVSQLMTRFKDEFKFAMALTGCENVSQINRSMIRSVESIQSKL